MNHIENIVSVLNQKGVKYIICGGVAAVLHGVNRLTLDLDISLDFEKENLDKFIEAVEELNLSSRAPVGTDILYDELKRKGIVEEKNAFVFTLLDINKPIKQIDIFLNKENSFKNLKDYLTFVNYKGIIFPVITAEKLIEMKSALSEKRDKDNSDIIELKKIISSK